LIALAHAIVNFENENVGPDQKTLKGQALLDRIAEAVKIIKTVNSELPNYDRIVSAALEHGVMKLKEYCSITPGIPVKPMLGITFFSPPMNYQIIYFFFLKKKKLAHPTKSIASIFERFEGNTFTCEFKYDGERNQVFFFFFLKKKKKNSILLIYLFFRFIVFLMEKF